MKHYVSPFPVSGNLLACCFSLLLSLSVSCRREQPSSLSAFPAFAWNKATVYFVLTDRFCNGDTANDANYGRIVDYGSERLNASTFHGGDFQGMYRKACEGYFQDLGVDVVWMTDVYEQIHGWMSGSGGVVNDFPHYGYHGYYPLDYTQIDKNLGTVSEFRQLVDELHRQGIRVMLGANLNDPGYPTLLDAVQLGFAPTNGLTEEEAARHRHEWSYDDWVRDCHLWSDWWTSEWIRTPDEDWNQDDPLVATLYGMPDYKTERTAAVSLPRFLKKKWAMEGTANDAWVNPSARALRSDRDWAPADYIVAWIASWVEEFGIDGFRCDVVEYVHLFRWKQLADACNQALAKWRVNHPDDPASQWQEPFYLTGDYADADIDYLPRYADAGFSSMVNFHFPKQGDLSTIVPLWQAYADSMQLHADWHPFSYLNNSYYRDARMEAMTDCATTFLLAPGVVQIFYGDEVNRKMSEARLNVDYAQAFRSDYDWNDCDTLLLEHYRRLGQFRYKHPAIGAGKQRTIDSRTCLRVCDGDTVLIHLPETLEAAIPVAGIYADGTRVVNAYTGECTTVAGGVALLHRCVNHVVLLLKDDES